MTGQRGMVIGYPSQPTKEASRTFSMCRTVWKVQERFGLRFWKHYVIQKYLKG
jgi:hypothetical protein